MQSSGLQPFRFPLSGKTFDFVIVGGGTAGLALAGRLAEWTNITVAVIEAGGDGTDVRDQITVPGMSYLNGLTKTAYDWAYSTTPQPNAGGNPLSWPRGKVLGGSSAINGGFWCRGSQPEYDAWNTLQNGATGAEDWGWNRMQASIKKAETFTPMNDADAARFSVQHESDAHGTDGPIQASFSSFQYGHLTTWVPTLVTLGLPHLTDPANGDNHGGVSFVPSIINPKNGSRSDSNFGYIAPYAGTNLVILTGFQVTKVNWNSTASGAAVAGGVSFAAAKGQTVYTVNAAKEVSYRAGGTIGSPQVLQVSGVGPAALVKGLGIDSVVDLPGVVSASLYMQATDTDTWAALRDKGLWDAQLAIWRQNGTGMWTYLNEATAYPAIPDLMGTDAGAWASGIDLDAALTTAVAAAEMDSTVQAGVKAQFAILKEWAASSSIGQVELIFNMFGGVAGQISIQFCLQHAFSRGYVRATSASVFDYPDINPNYLSISADADIMRAAIKLSRSIIATAPLSGVVKSETGPGPAVTADADLDSYIAKNSGTEYHPTGTNSMLPLAYGGVVDTRLMVYGTTNLRVVDVARGGPDEGRARAVRSSTSSSAGAPGTTGGAGNNNNNDPAAKTSGMSTTAKIAIGAAAGAAALLLLVALILVRRRSAHKRMPNARDGGLGAAKDDPWYAEDVPRAAFMGGAGSRHSAAPSSFSMDSLAAHPANQQVDYGYGQHYPPHQYAPYDPAQQAQAQYGAVAPHSPYDAPRSPYDAHSPHSPRSPYADTQPLQGGPAHHYGDVHSNLSTADLASLHPPPSPGHAPYTDSPPPRAYHLQDPAR
ncbi:GMC oxidoreductase-domain-containing protein [Mycena belliarum]|uniref:GMC oxidoreductase-domain-containing protein n=1 Tax=Mycena belliarum TaxID=1033014 RepID=A0AAD6TMP2_9AGAR|nr:GMC oxidoreductase-domain-containing protein [Mycena belliae]